MSGPGWGYSRTPKARLDCRHVPRIALNNLLFHGKLSEKKCQRWNQNARKCDVTSSTPQSVLESAESFRVYRPSDMSRYVLGRSLCALKNCRLTSEPLLIHGSLGPLESTTQTASWSVQPFLQGSRSWQTDRQTKLLVCYKWSGEGGQLWCPPMRGCAIAGLYVQFVVHTTQIMHSLD